ncbi:MAG: 6-phosphogluconolactonase [Planctomycetes bacterium]|nr:6-phosphogluconolactonase [Planctomycetota bacterium]
MRKEADPKIRIFANIEAIASAIAELFVSEVKSCIEQNRDCFIALSGGGTPKKVYETWAKSRISERVFWERVHFFWGDERCVPPDHPDSNFGMTRKVLLSRVPLPAKNIHPIRGELPPEQEAGRYENEIHACLPHDSDGMPRFDWILLGMGADGHTASLFPKAGLLDETGRLCGVAIHPETKEQRISITLPLISRAKRIIFIVTGSTKAETVRSVLKKPNEAGDLPVLRIIPRAGQPEWYLDGAAASCL